MNKKLFAILLSVLVAHASLVAPAAGAIISTAEMAGAAERSQQLSDIQRQLSRDDLQAAMVSLGVDPTQAVQRVANLSDSERARLASELNRLPAGGSVLGLLGAVFLVLLILELVGVTNVFNAI